MNWKRWAVSYLVAETLRGNNGDLIANTLVRLEVEGELGVVALDDDFGRLLDRLVKDPFSMQLLERQYA